MVMSTFKYTDVEPLVNRLRKSVNTNILSKHNLSFSINNVVELARNKTSEAKHSFSKLTGGSYSLNQVVEFARNKTSEARHSFSKLTGGSYSLNEVVEFARKKSSDAVASFAKVTEKLYNIRNNGIGNLRNVSKWENASNKTAREQTIRKKGAKNRNGFSEIKAMENKYVAAVRLARKNLLDRCPSLSLESIRRVGVTPGSIDIVITTVNFTTPTMDKTAKHYLNYPVDPNPSRKACEPRATVAQWSTDQWANKSFKCDYTSRESCCVESWFVEKGKEKRKDRFMWGKCTTPSTDNKFCQCKDCFDYRLRRNELLYNEVRFQLRSLEHNGVFVKSDTHPNGIIRKIFIVYNDGSGQSAPTWFTPNDPNVIAVPHEVLWSAYGDMTGHPSSNRNAIAALLHHIPGYVFLIPSCNLDAFFVASAI